MINLLDINKVIDKYYWYAFKVASKVFYNYYSSLPFESADLHQISALAIMDGYNRFDSKKNDNFDGYIKKYVSLYIISTFKKETTNKRKLLNNSSEKDNTTPICHKTPEYYLKLDEFRTEIKKVLRKFRPNQRKIIMDFLQGSRICDIVKELKTNKHKVSYVITKFKNEIIKNDLIKSSLNY
ncbi:sigma-70 family RNA polymerase sigma factor [Mycoplasmoides gallisepticum]|uniref:sigma-70 family RNA polymerase sigma factor n=1 Tax=Mycoplasmoides gallisepticum TaxID=2096 RepID=UPI0012490916|nr:sigma-70 family RNA polymerase sigma factor [Mycoplasmoides gallisepticum]QEX47038.1 sigma-70 family RNA polymerase sigma factor [Mycoplasmoides gallisepticum]ULH62342.1 sigma-70 family RNA polymerase sigma factor [Mycoplasmoides gallisepticum]ULH67681.1 sigma-70 family RNA polymerase sigma factor [Mycoplasmoides gallisepticum]ULH68408.1 sigma-70 family RNA polymerase sigma factor [Mycoplasmoides gallisepticum]WGG24049.1 sigma-70 family RNA polymerase sigma factor [Mycoplasmoides gallisepti